MSELRGLFPGVTVSEIVSGTLLIPSMPTAATNSLN